MGSARKGKEGGWNEECVSVSNELGIYMFKKKTERNTDVVAITVIERAWQITLQKKKVSAPLSSMKAPLPQNTADRFVGQ